MTRQGPGGLLHPCGEQGKLPTASAFKLAERDKHMSEQEKATSSYMQELDAWSDANVIFPLLNLDQTEQDWEEVAELVKKAGFILHENSMQSEACYYRYPGKSGLLRIAAHRYSRTQSRLNPAKNVICCLTFGETYTAKCKGSVDAKIMMAVGKFFLNAPNGSE